MAIRSSSSQVQDSRNRGGTEPKKKLKKLRSVKLSKLPSLKSSTRWANSRFEHLSIDLSNDDHPVELSNASPNYMKDTGCCSDAKESFQGGSESEGISESPSTYGSIPSTPSSQIWNSTIQGGTQVKKTLKKSRSIKPPTRRRAKSLIKVSDALPNYLKATSCSDGKKAHFQASPCSSESSFGSNDRSSSQSNSASFSLKSIRTLSRTSSLRILINKSSFKSKRPSVKKCSEVSHDSSVERATCSSTLKDSKFPQRVEIHHGVSESKINPIMKVCPYSHCSLNGHCHAPVPPPKHFVSKRRRSLKTQKSMKIKGLSTLGVKHKEFQSSNFEPAIQEGANGTTAMSPVGDEEGLNNFLEIHAKPNIKFWGGESEENEDAGHVEILFGETSYPEKSFQENLNRVKNFGAAEQDVLETPSNLKDTSLASCCIKTELDKSISEESDIYWKDEDIFAPKLDNDDSNCTLMGSDNADDRISTCNEEVSNLNSELCEDEPSNIDKRSNPNDTQRATKDSSVVSSATVCDPLEKFSADKEEKDADSEPDGEFHGGFIADTDSEPNPTTHETSTTHSNKEKHLSMWHLIHRHMVSGLATEASSQPLQGTDKEKLADDANTLPAQRSSGLCPNFSDSDLGIEDHDTVSQDIELRKIYAIKLVREAIEKILLPEVPDQLSDNKSITSGVTSDQELLDNNHGDGEELSILTSTVSAKDSSEECGHDEVRDNILLDPKETRLAADNISSPEEKRTASQVRNNSDKQAPKSWSNLKKLILLKRFIKALENVRKFNPQKSEILPLERDTEAGKVCLRHQVTGERRSAEECMIDYALQQVVSKLAPTQKRKVALLVEAFETVVPQPEEKNVLATFPELKEINQNCCSVKSELDKSDPKAANVDRKAGEGKEVIFSASVCDTSKELTAVRKEQNTDLKLENKFVEGFTPSGDSEPNAKADETYKSEFNQEKHINLWRVLHQHMASGLAAKAGSHQLDGADTVKKVNDTKTLLAQESSGSFGEFSDSDQHMGVENHNTASEDIELRKIYAIKLVREAIEKILLPEVQDHSSDDQYITSAGISDQELLEKNQGDGGEPSISTSKDGFRGYDKKEGGDDCSRDIQGTGLAADNISDSEEEKMTSKVGNKSDKQTPKSWTNLRKLILLKRFIKALEKVRKLNPRKPQILPLESDAEAEKVSLRHQVMEEKKNTEEWMLDYALRHVISELAPTQKRKVALLVKAFETVVPPSEERHVEVTKAISDDCYTSVSGATDTGTKTEEIIVSNLDIGEDNSIVTDKHSDVSDFCMSAVEVSQSCNELRLKSDDTLSFAGLKVLVDEKDRKGVHEDTVLSFNLGILKTGFELSGKKVELDCLSGAPSYINESPIVDDNGEPVATNNVVSSAFEYERLEQTTAAGEEKTGDSDPQYVLQGIPPLGDSEPDCTAKVACKSQMDKQKNIRMWHLIYQHVASGIAAKVGTQLFLDGDDEEEQADDGNTLPEIRISSCDDYSKTDCDLGKENHDANHDARRQRTEFNHTDAVKLVQESIDEILLPEIQDDSSDAQSITNDMISGQELLEKNHCEDGELSILTSTNSAKKSFREYDRSEVGIGILLDQKEKVSNITTTEEERAVLKVGNKSEQQKPRNWSKLKKLILLKRSIKALQKVRRSNHQAPRHLTMEPDQEAENVELRRQMMDERKKAEQWMLDHALQHIVTKLTPARKRKVSLLVEAFEAVVPLPEI
ncbi:uncharacterized protein LOC132291125 [Cornus florida]|uniref:uncharacterized protein LOC132291125 n=1 Tax=Cornus florida TaxID=4283 RepID=UPI00289E9371|nr:uncharacterized protein LOC132291125 [Cornus florida]XP_059646227.1 uncharacterized protein LOC132291125 [Cornus florida]